MKKLNFSQKMQYLNTNNIEIQILRQQCINKMLITNVLFF